MKKKMVAGVLALILSGIGISFSGAKAAEEAHTQKLFRSVVLRYGMTLEDLAAEHVAQGTSREKDAYIREVLFVNHLEDAESVRPGMHLVVPYFVTD